MSGSFIEAWELRFMIVPDDRVGLTDAAVVDWLIRMQRELRLLLATRRRIRWPGW